MDIYSENRPWGRFEKFHENQACTVKIIYVNANSRLSLQYHTHRWEFWRILKGTAEVELDHKTSLMAEGENVIVPCGFYFLMKRLHPRSTLFPYTTLFR